jgi:transcriptional regulator with XRE-family HTH domain
MSLLIIDGPMGNKTVLAVPTFVRAWRKYRKLTQEQLAEMVGLTAASISQLETGSQGFTHESLAAFAKALDCTPADLLSYDPRRDDSFWPLLQAAERLEGQPRRQLLRIITSALDLDAPGSR